MDEKFLQNILQEYYGLANISIKFLRKGGSDTYLVQGDQTYFLKVIGNAFSKTARKSVDIMVYLESHGFPVPSTILTRSGEALLEITINGSQFLIVLQEYVDGDEPDLLVRAGEVGKLTGRLHQLLQQYSEKLIEQDKHFFVGRYLNFLRLKNYPRISEYEAIAETLWQKVLGQPKCNCHGDLHRGNLLEDRTGKIYCLDFDTVCYAPRMFDIMVMCDMTDYFRLQQPDVERTLEVYKQFLSGYMHDHVLTEEEQSSFSTWVAIRHFQLQATIVEIYGIECMKESFADAQLDWLKQWLELHGAEGV